MDLQPSISATDWMPDGWTIEESVSLARTLRGWGVNLIVASSGGTSPQQQIALAPGLVMISAVAAIAA